MEVVHTDLAGNSTPVTRNLIKDYVAPTATIVLNHPTINRSNIGNNALSVTVNYNDVMDQSVMPTITMQTPAPTTALSDGTGSGWTSSTQIR